jgi:hypothetical protein
MEFLPKEESDVLKRRVETRTAGDEKNVGHICRLFSVGSMEYVREHAGIRPFSEGERRITEMRSVVGNINQPYAEYSVPE